MDIKKKIPSGKGIKTFIFKRLIFSLTLLSLLSCGGHLGGDLESLLSSNNSDGSSGGEDGITNSYLTITSHAENDQITRFTDTITGSCNEDYAFTITPGTGVTVITTTPTCNSGSFSFEAGFTSAHGTAEDRTITVENGSESITRTLSMRYSCPIGFIGIPGNSDAGIATSDFCVAKYEMKAETDPGGVDFEDGNNGGVALSLANYRVESRANGTPWVSITKDNAKAECIAQGWTLISNVEWQTIARNLEANSGTWISDSGTLRIPRGHTDSEKDPACNTSATLAIRASTNDEDGYFCTGQSSSDAWDALSSNPGGNEQRRTNTLSNSEVIWDFAGNVYEWISDDIPVELEPEPDIHVRTFIEFDATNCNDATGGVGTDICFPSGAGNRLFFGPLGDYNSSYGVGTVYGGNGAYGGDIRRGGGWDEGYYTGIFSVSIPFISNFFSEYTGFRCSTSPSNL